MEGKIAEEGFRRQEENQKLKEEMCVRMDEPLKHEESTRTSVQNDSANERRDEADSVGERKYCVQ